jgi:hypothetical protein
MLNKSSTTVAYGPKRRISLIRAAADEFGVYKVETVGGECNAADLTLYPLRCTWFLYPVRKEKILQDC